MAGGAANLVGINNADGGDVRGELLALFGRLPNLGGQLLSESFRGAGKMKTAQSAPELKWLLDGGTGPGRAGGGPRPAATKPPAAAPVGGGGAGPPAGTGDADDYGDGDSDDEQQVITVTLTSADDWRMHTVVIKIYFGASHNDNNNIYDGHVIIT